MTAARIHIFMDGFGWSTQRDADYSQLKVVRGADELPPLDPNCLITFMNASDTDDLRHLQDMIQELREEATWSDE